METQTEDYALKAAQPKEYTAYEATQLAGAETNGLDVDFEPDVNKSLERSKSMGLVDPGVTPEQYAPKHKEMMSSFNEKRRQDYEKFQNAAIFLGDQSKRIDYSGGNDKKFIQSRDFRFNRRPTADATKEKSFLGDRSTDIHTQDEVLDAQGVYRDSGGQYKPLEGFGIDATNSHDNKTFVLAKEIDPNTGQEVWTEKDASQVLKGSLLRSASGPQAMKEGYMATLAHSFWNGAANMFDSNLGSFIEMIGNGLDWDSFKKTGNLMQNTAAASRFKRAKELESGGLFEGDNKMKHFTAGIGELLGQLAPVIATGFLTAPVGAAVMGEEAVAAGYNSMRMLGLLGDMFKGAEVAKGISFGRVIGGRAIQGLPTFGASLYAGDRMNQEMKELGMDESHRLKMYGAMVLMTALTEDAIGSNNITRGLGHVTGGAMKSEFDDLFKPYARQLATVAASGLSEKGFASKVAGIAKSFGAKYNALLEKAADGGILGRLGQGLSGGFEEGSEEVVQGIFENGFKLFSNAVTNGTLDSKGNEYGKFNVDGLFDGALESFTLGAIGGFAPGLAFKTKESADKAGSVASETELMYSYVQKHGWNNFYQKYDEDKQKYLASFQPQESFTDAAKSHADFIAASNQQSELIRDTLLATNNETFTKQVLGDDKNLLQSYVNSVARSKQLNTEAEAAQNAADKQAKLEEKAKHDAYIAYVESGEVLKNRKAAAGINVVNKSFGMTELQEGVDYGFDAESKGEFGALKMLKDTEADITAEKDRILTVADAVINRTKDTDRAFTSMNEAQSLDEMASLVMETKSKGLKLNGNQIKSLETSFGKIRQKALDDLIKSLATNDKEEMLLDDIMPNTESDKIKKQLEGEDAGHLFDGAMKVLDFKNTEANVVSEFNSLSSIPNDAEALQVENYMNAFLANGAQTEIDKANAHVKELEKQLVADPKNDEDREKNDGILSEIQSIQDDIETIVLEFKDGNNEEKARSAGRLTAHLLAVRNSFKLFSDQELDNMTANSMKAELARLERIKRGIAIRSFGRAFGDKGRNALNQLGVDLSKPFDPIDGAVTMNMLNAYTESIKVKLEQLIKEEGESEALNEQMRQHNPRIDHLLSQKIGNLLGIQIEDFDENDPIGSWKKATRTIQTAFNKPANRSAIDRLTELMAEGVHAIEDISKSPEDFMTNYENRIGYSNLSKEQREFFDWYMPFIAHTRYGYGALGKEGDSDSTDHVFPARPEERAAAANDGKIENDLLAFDVSNFIEAVPNSKNNAQVPAYTLNFFLQLNGDTHSLDYDAEVGEIIDNNNAMMPGWGDITYEQQLALRSAVAFMRGSQSLDPSVINTHNRIMAAWGVENFQRTDAKGKPIKGEFDFFYTSPQFMSVLGSAGSGKSTRVNGTAIEIDLRDKLKNNGFLFSYDGSPVNVGEKPVDIEYIIGGFSETVVDNFRSYFEQAAARVNGYSGGMINLAVIDDMPLNKIISGLTDGSLAQENKIVQVFIDESSQMPALELRKAMSANSTLIGEDFAENRFSVMLFGDPLQSSADKAIRRASTQQFQSWKMIQVHRSGLPVLWHFQRFMRSQISFVSGGDTMIFNSDKGFNKATYFSDIKPKGDGVDLDFKPAMASSILEGVLVVPEALSKKVVDAFIARMKNNITAKVNDISLIVNNQDSLRKLIKEHPELEMWRDNILFIHDPKLAAQGMTIKEVFYVNDGVYKDGYKDKAFKKDTLTMGTRASTFLMMAGPAPTITQIASDRLERFQSNESRTAQRVKDAKDWLGLGVSGEVAQMAKPQPVTKPQTAKQPEPVVATAAPTVVVENPPASQPTKADKNASKKKSTEKERKQTAKKRDTRTEMDRQMEDKGYIEMTSHYFIFQGDDAPTDKVVRKASVMRTQLATKLKKHSGDINLVAYKPGSNIVGYGTSSGYNGIAFAYSDPSVLSMIGQMVDELGDEFTVEEKAQLAYALTHSTFFNPTSKPKGRAATFLNKIANAVEKGGHVKFSIAKDSIYPSRLTFRYNNDSKTYQNLELSDVLAQAKERGGTPALVMLPEIAMGDSTSFGRVPMLYIGEPISDPNGIDPFDLARENQMSLAQIEVKKFGEAESKAFGYLDSLLAIVDPKEAGDALEELFNFNHALLSDNKGEGLKILLSASKANGKEVFFDKTRFLNLKGDKKALANKLFATILKGVRGESTAAVNYIAKNLRFPLVKDSKAGTYIEKWHHLEVSKNPIDRKNVSPLEVDTDLIRMRNNSLLGVNAQRMPVVMNQKVMDDFEVSNDPLNLEVPRSSDVVDMPVLPQPVSEPMPQTDGLFADIDFEVETGNVFEGDVPVDLHIINPANTGGAIQYKPQSLDDGEAYSYVGILDTDVHGIEDEINDPIFQAAVGELMSQQIDGSRVGVDQVSFGTMKAFWGYATRAGIHLSTQNGVIRKGTKWHELTHFIEFNILEESQRNKVRSEIAKTYPNLTDEDGQDAISEKLAELTRDYALERRHRTGISKFLGEIIDWFVRLFDSVPFIGNSIRKLEYDIYHGRFADRVNTYLSLLPNDADMNPLAYSISAQEVQDNFAGHNQSAAAITKHIMSRIFDSPAYSNIVKNTTVLNSNPNTQLLTAIDGILSENAHIVLSVLARNGFLNLSEDKTTFTYSDKALGFLNEKQAEALRGKVYHYQSYINQPRQVFDKFGNFFKFLMGKSLLKDPVTIGSEAVNLTIDQLVSRKDPNLFEQILFDVRSNNVALSVNFRTYFAYLSLNKDLFGDMIGGLFPKTSGVKEYLNGNPNMPIGREWESSQAQYETGKTNPLDSINDFFRNMLRTIKTDSGDIIPEELHRTAIMTGAIPAKSSARTPTSKKFVSFIEKYLDDVANGKREDNDIAKALRAHYRTFFDKNVLSYASWIDLAKMNPQDAFYKYLELYSNGLNGRTVMKDAGHEGAIGGYVDGQQLTMDKLSQMYMISKGKASAEPDEVMAYWGEYVRSKAKQSKNAIALYTNTAMSVYNQNVTKQIVEDKDKRKTKLQAISAMNAKSKVGQIKNTIMAKFTTGLGIFNLKLIEDKFGTKSRKFGITNKGETFTFAFKNSNDPNQSINNFIEFGVGVETKMTSDFKKNDAHKVIIEIFRNFGITFGKKVALQLLQENEYSKDNPILGTGFLKEHLPILIATATTMRAINTRVKEDELKPYGEGLFIVNRSVFRKTPAGYMEWGYDDNGKFVRGEAAKAWAFIESKGMSPSNANDIFGKNIGQDGDVTYNKEANEVVEGDSGTMFFFSEYGTMIETLAKNIAAGAMGTPKTYVNGDMRILTAKSSFIEQQHNQNEKGEHSNARQLEIYNELGDAKKQHPHFDKEGKSLIPMLTGEANGVKQLSLLLSHKEGYREVGNDKATFSDMATAAVAAIRENFTDGMAKSLVDNMGERPTHFVTFDLRKKDANNNLVRRKDGKISNGVLVWKSTKDGAKNIAVDYQNVVEHIGQLGSVITRAEELSKERMEKAVSELSKRSGVARGKLSHIDYLTNFISVKNKDLAAQGKPLLKGAKMNDEFVGLGLIEGQDYLIYGDKIQLGHDYTGNRKLQTLLNKDRLYGLQVGLSKAKDDEAKIQAAIDRFFEPLYSNFLASAFENNFKLPDDLGKMWDKSKPYEERLSPVVKGMVIQHFINNAYFFASSYGSLGTFEGIIDASKRLNDMASPKEVPVMRHPVYTTFNSVVVEDFVETHTALGTIRGAASNKIKMTDGLIRSNPILEYIYYDNTGGELGQIDWKAQQKRKGNFKDIQKHKLDDKKGMDYSLSATEFLYSEAAQEELRMMLNPTNAESGTLWHLFEGYYNNLLTKTDPINAYYKAIELAGDRLMNLVENDDANLANQGKYLYENMLGMIEYKSTIKSSNRENVVTNDKLKQLHGSGSILSVYNKRNWSENGLQTLLNKNTADTDMMKFSQMFNHLTLAPWGWKNGRTLVMIDKMAQLSKEAPEQFLSKGAQDGVNLPVSDVVKNKMMSTVKSIAGENHLAALLSNKAAGIDYPQVEAKAFQAIRSELVRTGIKFEMPAHRLTEVSAYHIDVYEVDGIYFSPYEIKQLFTGKDKAVINGKEYSIDDIKNSKRKLRPNRIWLDKNRLRSKNPDLYNKAVGIVEEELKRANISMPYSKVMVNGKPTDLVDAILDFDYDMDGEYATNARQRIFEELKGSGKEFFKHLPSESIVPPIKDLTKYGFAANSQFNEIFTLYKENEDGSISIESITDGTNDLRSKIRTLIQSGYKTMAKNKKGEPFALYSNGFYSFEFENSVHLLKDFNQAFVQRTPSSNASSGSMHKIVGWHHGGGSVIFSSAKRSLITGHDHDGDEINAYYREADGDEPTTLKDVQRELFDYTNDYYEDIDNAEYFMTPIDMAAWKDLKSNFEKNMSLDDGNPDLQFFDLASALHNRVNSVAGKTVGQFARAQKAFDFMASAQQFWKYYDKSLKKPDTISTNQFIDEFARPYQFLFDEDSFGQLLADLSDMVNLATDNVKEQILGALFVNGENAFMVAAIKMQEDYLRSYMMKRHPNGRKEAIKADEKGNITEEIDIDYSTAGFPRLFLDFMRLPFVKSVLKSQSNSMSAVEGKSMKIMEAWHEAHNKIAKFAKGEKFVDGFELSDKFVKDDERVKGKSYLFFDGGYNKSKTEKIAYKDLTDADYDGFVASFNQLSKGKDIVLSQRGLNAAKKATKSTAPLIYEFLNTDVKDFIESNKTQDLEANAEVLAQTEADAQVLANFIMAGDFIADASGVFQLDQGTPNEDWTNENLLRNIEFLVGMDIKELLEVGERFMAEGNTNAIMKYFDKAGKTKRVQYSLEKKRSFNIANKWTTEPIADSQNRPVADIWWGDEGSRSNGILSNIAPRHFKWRGLDNGKLLQYYSVEHAYQTWKSGAFDQDTYDAYKKVGPKAGVKIQGKQFSEDDKGRRIEAPNKSELMALLIKNSFESDTKTSKEARQALIDTKNARFTHVNDKGFWSGEFPRLLESYRESINPTLLGDSQKKTYAESYHYQFDMLSAVLARPDLMSWIEQANSMREIMAGAFVKHDPMIKGFMFDFFDEIGYDMPSKGSYGKAMNKVQDYLVHKFSNSSQADYWNVFQDGLPIFSLAVTDGTSRTLREVDIDNKLSPFNINRLFFGDGKTEVNTLKGYKTDLSEPDGRYRFVLGFPRFIEQVRDTLLAYQDEYGKQPYFDNFFLNNLVLEGDANSSGMLYATLTDSKNMDKDTEAKYQGDFARLPKKFREMIGWYVAVKDSFSYSEGSLSRIVDMSVHEKFGSFIKQFKNEMRDNPAAIKNDLDNHVKMNMIADTSQNWLQAAGKDGKNIGELELKMEDGVWAKTKISLGNNIDAWVALYKNGDDLQGFRTAFPALANSMSTTQNVIQINGAALFNNKERKEKQKKEFDPALASEFFYFDFSESLQRYMIGVVDRLSNPTKYPRGEAMPVWRNLPQVTSKEAPFAVGDIVKLPFGLTVEVADVSGKQFTFRALPNKSDHAIFQKGSPLISNKSVDREASTAMSTGMKSDHLQRMNTAKTVRRMVDHFKTMFPNIDVQEISDNHPLVAKYGKALSFVVDGTIYLNMDRVEPDVAMEEFMHIWNEVIKDTNPQLWQSLLSKAKEDADFMHRGKMLYAERWSDDEIVANAVREEFVRRAGSKPKGLLASIWDTIKQFFRKMFGYGVEYSNLDGIKEDATLSEIINTMLDDYEAGRVFSNISTEELAGRMPGVMTAMSTGAIRFNGFDKTTFENHLLYIPEGYDVAKEREQRLIDSLALELMRQYKADTANQYQQVSYLSPSTGKRYSIKKSEFDGDFNRLKSIVAANIAPEESRETKDTPKLFSDFLKTVGRDSEMSMIDAAAATVKKMYSTDYISKKIEAGSDLSLTKHAIESKFEMMLSHIGFNPTTDTAFMSNDLGLSKHVLIPEDVKSDKTLVIVHNAGQPYQSISLLQFSDKYVTESFDSGNKSLADKIVSEESKAIQRGVEWKMNNANVQNYLSGLQLIAMKKANPNLKVKNVYAFHFHGNEDAPALFKIAEKNTLGSILDQTKAMLQFTIERDLMPDSVLDAMRDDKVFDQKQYGYDPIMALVDMARKKAIDSDDEKETKVFDAIADSGEALRRSFQSDEMKEFQRLLLNRKRYIERQNEIGSSAANMTEEERSWAGKVRLMATNEEYRAIANAFAASENRGLAVGEEIANLNTFEKFMMSGDRFKADIEQLYFNRLQATDAFIAEEYKGYLDASNKVVSDLKSAFGHGQFTSADVSDELYSGMMQKGQMADGTVFNTGNIVVGDSVDETFRLLLPLNQNKSEVQVMEMAKAAFFFEKAFFNSLVDSIIFSKGYKFRDIEGNVDRSKVEQYVRHYRAPGTMPVISGGLNEKIKSILKDVKGGAVKADKLQEFATAVFEEMYPEARGNARLTDSFAKSENMFLAQFEFGDPDMQILPTSTGRNFGSKLRMKLLGIETDMGGNIRFKGNNQEQKDNNKRINSILPSNLQYIVNTAMVESISNIEYGTRLNPVAEMLVLKALNTAEMAEDIDKEQAKKDIAEVMMNIQNAHTNRKIDMIKGNVKIFGKEVNPNQIMMAAMVMKGMAVFGMNPEAMLKNGLQAGMAAAMRGMSGYFSKNDFASVENIKDGFSAAAQAYLMRDEKMLEKFEALNWYLRVNGLDRREMISSPILVAGERVLTGKDAASMGFKFVGEKVPRLGLMAAMLMKEGLWEALEVVNGKLSFDILKWNNPKYVIDGRLTPDGEVMNRALREEILREGGEYADKQMNNRYAVLPFAKRTSSRIKNQIDMVFGSMSEDTRAELQRSMLGKAVMQFWSFAPQYFWNFFGTKNKSAALAKWEVEGGEIVEKMPLVEGVMESLAAAWTLLREEGGREMWEKLEPQQKDNVTRLALTVLNSVLIFGVFAAFIKWLAGAEDDKELKKKAPVTYWAYNKIFSKAFSETASELYFANEVGKKFRGSVPPIDYMMSIPEAMLPLADPRCWSDPKYMEHLWNGEIDRATGKRRSGLKSVMPYGLATDQAISFAKLLWIYGFGREE